MTQEYVVAKRRRSPPEKDTEDCFDDSDDEKDRRDGSHSDKVYGDACSIGQFFLNPCLFICNMIVHSCQSQYFMRLRTRLKAIHLLFIIPPVLLLKYTISSPSMPVHPLRPLSDAHVNNLNIRISALDLTSRDDLGGWLSPPSFRQPKPTVHLVDRTMVDFGSLKHIRLRSEQFRREISEDDIDMYNDERRRELNRMDIEDAVVVKYQHDDELDYSECRRPNWKSSYFPVCNNFHEMDMVHSFDKDILSVLDRDNDMDTYLFSHGYYRDAWFVDQVDLSGRMVLKTLRMKHEFTARTFGNVQRDAVVMERLTSSPYVINMYGHCATSLTVEPITYEIEEYIVPEGYIHQNQLNDRYDVNPQNDYTPYEKLEMALEMAESLAVLHGFKDGLIVHDDVQLCQWLRLRNGRLVLGDFNRAEVMEWNDEKEEYCKYNNGYAYGNYRSPEEFDNKDLDEKIDIFSFGNNVYALLTGLWPFYENEDDGFVQQELIGGNTSFIDDRYRTRSYGEGKMVEIIEMCWKYRPEDRPDIFEIVRILRRVVDEALFRDKLAQEKKASNY